MMLLVQERVPSYNTNSVSQRVMKIWTRVRAAEMRKHGREAVTAAVGGSGVDNCRLNEFSQAGDQKML
jgi:hypothetical protein